MGNAEKSDPRKRGGRIHLREIEFAAVRAEDAASLVSWSGDHALSKQMRRVFAGGQELEGMRACMERWGQKTNAERRETDCPSDLSLTESPHRKVVARMDARGWKTALR